MNGECAVIGPEENIDGAVQVGIETDPELAGKRGLALVTSHAKPEPNLSIGRDVCGAPVVKECIETGMRGVSDYVEVQ